MTADEKERSEKLILKKHDLLNRAESDRERAEEYRAEAGRIDVELNALLQKERARVKQP